MSFSWVPAAVNPPWSAVAIYTRYRRNNPDTIEIIDWGPRHSLYQTPDRDLLITTDANFHNPIRPLNSDWDDVLFLAPYTASYRDYGFKYAMNNYTAYLKDKPYITNHRRDQSWKRDGQVWISDSGGFQFKLMKVKYLDPAQIVNWYNQNSDIGIALDVPIGTSHDLLEMANRVQKRNTKIMLERKRDDLEIMTALHGETRNDYLRSADYLANDQISKLSFSGFYIGTLTESLIALLSVHKKYGQYYDHYHILGVSDIAKTLVFARWAETRIPGITVTADSSRHLQEALRWGYYTRVGATQRLHKVGLGKSFIGGHLKQTTPQLLPCQCIVCRTVKYIELLALTRRAAVVPYLILYHNQFVIRDMVTKITDYAREMDDKEYLEFAKSLTRPSSHRELEAGLQVINDFDEYGGREISKHYRYFAVRSRLHAEDLADERTLDQETEVNVKARHRYLKRTMKKYLGKQFKPEDHGKPYKAKANGSASHN